jgi:uncharacterized protein YcbX
MDTRTPDITGTVTALEQDRARVEADAAASGALRAAVVTLSSARTITWADGRTASTADVRAGDVISVWFAGPARESYPVQADADRVVIESRSQ